MLLPICLSSGDDSYDFVLLPIAVTHDKNSQGCAEAQKNKPLFFLRMLWVRQDPRILIKKGAARLLKGDTVLSPIGTVLHVIPLKHQVRHGAGIVTTL